MSEFTPTGLTVDRYADILAKMIADQKGSFGDNWQVDNTQSKAGLHAAVLTDLFAKQNEAIEALAAGFVPSKATGPYQSELVQLNGITRTESEFSTSSVNVTATAASGCTIIVGSLVADPLTNIQWATDLEVILTAGQTLPVSVTAVVEGPTEAAAGTLTKIVNPILGWESVTNPSAAVPGLNEETDAALRVRQQRAARRTGQAGPDAFYSAIADLSATDDQYVHENRSNVTDTKGVPGNSIWCIVSGGSNADIAEAIYDVSGGGAPGWFGNVTVPHTSAVSGVTYDVKFSRPTDVDIYITMNLSKSPTYPGDGDELITQNLLDYFTDNQKIATSVVHSRLYDPINEVQGHSVVDLFIGTSSDPSGVDDIPIDIFQRAVTTEPKIIIRTV